MEIWFIEFKPQRLIAVPHFQYLFRRVIPARLKLDHHHLPTPLIALILHPRRPLIAKQINCHLAYFPRYSLPVPILILLLHFPPLPQIQGLRFYYPQSHF